MIAWVRQKAIPLIKTISVLIIIIALLFVGRKIWLASDQLLLHADKPKLVVIVILFGLFYIINDILLAYIWKRLLSWFGDTQVSLKTCLGIYGRTQIAKYIPGNFLHLPNRHMTGWQSGLSHPAQIGAATYEISGLLVTSGILAVIGLFKLNDPETFLMPETTILVIITFSIVLITFSSLYIVQFFLPRIQGINIPSRTWAEILKVLLPTWMLYFGFFGITGLIIYGIIGALTGKWFDISPWIVFSASGTAWVLGFITPGAPAGAGVREAILILILSKFTGEATSISIALILRMITILGDVGFYLIAQFILR